MSTRLFDLINTIFEFLKIFTPVWCVTPDKAPPAIPLQRILATPLTDKVDLLAIPTLVALGHYQVFIGAAVKTKRTKYLSRHPDTAT